MFLFISHHLEDDVHSLYSLSNGIIFLVLLSVTALVAIASPVLKRKNVTLPLEAWTPYTLDSNVLFSVTYVFQCIALVMTACTSASVEGLVLTFVLQTCAQLELLFHRLELIPYLLKDYKMHSEFWIDESNLITDCIKNHMHIYMIGDRLNNVFGLVIFTQFFSSMISLCAVVYELSCLSLSNSTFWLMLSCMSSVIMQTFLYCFYGEKIIQKSTEVSYAIQQMDWTVLTNRGRKNLLIMMIRASQPIELRGSSMVVMSFKTFVEITKSAYSAYNLLSATLTEFVSPKIVVLMSKSKPIQCQSSNIFIDYMPIIVEESTAVADAVHQMNWILLTNRSKKDLLIIMTRAISPIKLTVSAVAVMSIKTFVKLSRLDSQNPTYWIMVASVGSSLTQTFLYCLYGEILIQKSTAVSNAIYEINWISFSHKTKKALTVMMLRTSKPISLSGASVVVMSIKTFMNIIKSAYSAYNLLGSTK
ncbi:odorant receptor 82a-like [Leptopilina heterotoma]|uniref:odorant receptor 82a-like n=1 Tax=Leptopilina heterotoma TaxID=63436 RepID=UPI001CA80996|nr:odorant receptor 82a-like [Leptopilina heterotoma]